mgnify:CR=1 FL=1
MYERLVGRMGGWLSVWERGWSNGNGKKRRRKLGNMLIIFKTLGILMRGGG